jgi:aryl-alcohol dehydrogenase-like predicted oxidoreductase
MRYGPLGRTGLTVSELSLGAMMFGAFGNADHDDAGRIIDRALDAGVNVVDTADMYSAGESEAIVGRALSSSPSRRDDVVLATKVGLPVGSDDPNRRGTSRRWITQAVEDSLRRLRTDWIDLYQVHRLDPATDLDETLGVLSDLVHAGKIRAFGASTVPASQIVEAQWLSERRGRERMRSEQPPYSLLLRGVEADVLPTCQRHGLGVLVYSPLAGGWLSGGYRKGRPVSGPGSAVRRERFAAHHDADAPANATKLDAVEALAQLADEAGLTLVQLAIAFVTHHPAVSSAIIGPRTAEHLDAYLAAADLELPADVLERIDAIVEPATNVSPTGIR